MDIDPRKIAYPPSTGVRRIHETPLVTATAVVPLDDEAQFLDRQGRVHARVSVNFVEEFGCYLGAPLPRPREES